MILREREREGGGGGRKEERRWEGNEGREGDKEKRKQVIIIHVEGWKKTGP